MKGASAKGSFTIEAAVIITLFMLIIATGMKIGVNCYLEIKSEKEHEELKDFWVVDDFYRIKTLSGAVGGKKSQTKKEDSKVDLKKKEDSKSDSKVNLKKE